MPHVTFVHGIANKPSNDVLLRIWRDSLARDGGLDLGAEGVTSEMVYWADVMYEAPVPRSIRLLVQDSSNKELREKSKFVDLTFSFGRIIKTQSLHGNPERAIGLPKDSWQRRPTRFASMSPG